MRSATSVLKGFGLVAGGGTICAGCFLEYDRRFPDTFQHSGAVRFARAATAAARVASLYLVTPQDLWGGCHERAAQILLDVAMRNRGVFIKVGQHMASMDYILPDAYVDTMRVLQSNAPLSDIRDVEAVICQELGIRDVEEAFEDFEPKPLGAASLAQVHRAQLKETGEVVAVKVQHREVMTSAVGDTSCVHWIVRMGSAIFPQARFWWLTDLMRECLPKELDFKHEARNAEEAERIVERLNEEMGVGAASIASFKKQQQQRHGGRGRGATEGGTQRVVLQVPKVHRKWTTQRVLTMQFCGGRRVDDVGHLTRKRINPGRVCRALGRLFSKMTYEEGFVNCDPHPGNILVDAEFVNGTEEREKGRTSGEGTGSQEREDEGRPPDLIRVTLLDHGLYSRLSPEFRYNYASLWCGLIEGEWDRVDRSAEFFGVERGLSRLFACICCGRQYAEIEEGGLKGAEERERARRKRERKEKRKKERRGGGGGPREEETETRSLGMEETMTFVEEQRKDAKAKLQSSVIAYFPDIMKILDTVPRDFLLLLKTKDLLQHLERTLGVDEKLALLPILRACVSETAAAEAQGTQGMWPLRLVRSQLIRWHASWKALQLSIAESVLAWREDCRHEAFLVLVRSKARSEGAGVRKGGGSGGSVRGGETRDAVRAERVDANGGAFKGLKETAEKEEGETGGSCEVSAGSVMRLRREMEKAEAEGGMVAQTGAEGGGHLESGDWAANLPFLLRILLWLLDL
uniref:ABC1 atypical kinase-like domain-containing protein n=1 Tax=Chromera velia CCMP2878 TaxID=1169474 RepID=A0A0G4GM50_9ALVE|eukprot:Cvel_4906.t1-p1 / transcript=Cvel_4906.t1 / gene=Cvel_4906 / organism=Chromera_velia_CCMP2878 / gene_product=Uncharacterized aarF domain-containing protein, putative / transcript_product=Uncharacterized aarF domain-containing protein, putative / location=Cvel_scaffold221:46795-53879(+) / protein_length=745 / sequence_SO=supercontig / SO=protein_coding / is_pseudo=false